jgi:ATP-dependent DNA helicase RecQ
MAREQKVPAYVVLHDSTLEELCQRRPTTLAGLRQVAGIGERKADVYGAEILQVLRNFDTGMRAATSTGKEPSPAEQTLELLNRGCSFEEIARQRARQVETIVCTVANLIETGRVQLQVGWVSPGAQPHIETACAKVGVERLADIKASVPPFVSYNDVRLVVAHLRAQNRPRAVTA